MMYEEFRTLAPGDVLKDCINTFYKIKGPSEYGWYAALIGTDKVVDLTDYSDLEWIRRETN